MTDNQGLIARLKEILPWKKSKKYYAKYLSISETEVDLLYQELGVKKKKVNNDTKSVRIDVEKGTLESTVVCNFEPKDDKELALLHKIDLEKYVITNYWSKLLPNGKFTSSVFSRRKKQSDYTLEDFSNFLNNYTSNYIPKQFIQDINEKEYVDLEISIADYHLAKFHIDGDNNPLVRVERYFNIAKDLILKAKAIYNIKKVIFPISNDFFHTDNYHNTTTNGTPQDTIMSYSHEYELGFNLLVETIQMFLEYCEEVKVILVQGNHDRTKSYYLAHGLDVFFKTEDRVSFNRNHSVVKAIIIGNTFIGYHHGNCKLDDLPLLFATHPEYGSSFGNALYREVHTGDKHHYMAKEVKGVRIQQMPSLSGTDRWHADNNYVHSVRAALALVYDEEKGKITEFETRL